MEKQVIATMVAIVGTGVILNLMGEGYLGQSAQKAAQFVTKGYGV
jgi:hypothetical protein|tara:strand:- start:4804 stop:4938 length:135 start_codon:yes stop_codon:yes gene_type:complete